MSGEELGEILSSIPKDEIPVEEEKVIVSSVSNGSIPTSVVEEGQSGYQKDQVAPSELVSGEELSSPLAVKEENGTQSFAAALEISGPNPAAIESKTGIVSFNSTIGKVGRISFAVFENGASLSSQGKAPAHFNERAWQELDSCLFLVWS